MKQKKPHDKSCQIPPVKCQKEDNRPKHEARQISSLEQITTVPCNKHPKNNC